MEKPAPTDHPVHELIRERWSPRVFAERDVEPEKLRSLLEAARWAPSSYNEQPWVYFVARRQDTDEYQKMLGCLVEKNQEWAHDAPVLMLTVAHLTHKGKPNRHAFHDVGQASALLTVQATALDLVVHQMAGIEVEEVRRRYAVPEGWEAVTGIAIGYPEEAANLAPEMREKESAPRKRKPLEEFVFAGTWENVADFVA